MSASTTIDTSKSLAELTGVDWGVAPPDAGLLVRERHEFRGMPLKSLSDRALRRLLSLDFQNDCHYLVPHCLRRMTTEPADGIEKFSDRCNLLVTVLRTERFNWLTSPELVRSARRQVKIVCYALDQLSDDAEQTDDSLEYYRVLHPNTQMQATLYEALTLFEQRLSKIEPEASPE